MKRTSYPTVNDNECARQLACGIILESAKQYCDPKTTPQMKSKIRKDLRNNQLLNGLTDDLAIHTAEQLELHEDEIADRLGLSEDEEESEEMLC